MADYYDSEALGNLIKAVQEYQKDLSEYYQILSNAANVCDIAMGSDAVSAKHIANLYSALEYLSKTAQIAEEVAQALLADKAEADDI